MKNALRLIALAFAVCVLCVQCNKSRKMTQAESRSDGGRDNQPAVPLVIQRNPEYVWNERSDAYNLENVRVSGDTLWMDITHGGGCEEHEFSAHTSGLIMKSLPPKIMIWMEHNAHGDMCRALLTRSVPIDLKTIRMDGLHEIIILPNGNTGQSVSYKY